VRTTTLGYVQRGGRPGAFDRLLATRSGAAAAECMANGNFGVLVGMRDGEICSTPLAEVVAGKKELDLGLLDLVEVLAR
jgi:6-phosphofructokinase 1